MPIYLILAIVGITSLLLFIIYVGARVWRAIRELDRSLAELERLEREIDPDSYLPPLDRL